MRASFPRQAGEPASLRPPSGAAGMRFGLRAALRILKIQPLRTLLAMLGVFLGALLLVGITHVLGAISLSMEAQARSLGSHIATITPERPSFSRREDVRFVSGTESAGDAALAGQDDRYAPLDPAATLTPDDLEVVMTEIPYFTAGVPFIVSEGWISHGGEASGCTIMGVTPDYPGLHAITPAHGRFFDDEEERLASLVCVLGDALARRIFGDPAAALDAHVRIHRSAVRVLGIMAPRGADSGGANMDEVVFVPVRTAMQRFSTQDHVSGLFLEMRSREAIPVLSRSIEALLRQRHRLTRDARNDFSMSFAGQVDEMVTNATELMTTLGLIGAGISFFVGSLGIFSIMILMVHARKTEIGIRRAVGAPKRLILLQFLFEAGLMAGAGGALGVVAALALTQAVAALGLLPGYLNIPLAVGVCLLSLICGLLAGGYPAWKAARLEVLAALRE
ncbi:ABC transporter permease [Pseudodesulfovibrio alkaliphilus]|nr:ABC transporter permease [Pseudodesulfovibrio alkaliphilus]